MSFRVKLRVKYWKTRQLAPNPIVRVDSGAPVTDLLLRYYEPRKLETFSQTYTPEPGVTVMSWNGVDPINRAAAQ